MTTARSAVSASAAAGIVAAALSAAAAVHLPLCVRQLVPQAALEPPAQAGKLRGVQAQVLLLRHLDGDRLERRQERRAAERTSARSVAAQGLGLVTDAD